MKTELGIPSKLGSFTSNLEGLSASTKYYARAYISRGSAVVYGSDTSFITLSDALPVLTTTTVADIEKTTAVSGGDITNQGGTPVTARGVCWSLTTITALTNNKTTDGDGTGTFTSDITGLTPGTNYYVRAYATNGGGTKLGEEVSFTTLSDAPVLPDVTTAAVSEITTNSAKCGGEVINEGGASVTARGVCWSTSTNPTVYNSKTVDGEGKGTFTSSLTGLNTGVTYFVRSYATNSIGTSYGNEFSFVTATTLPILTTVPITAITSVSAKSGGDILSSGGLSILSKGLCWKTTSGPTTDDSKTEDGTGSEIYSSNISGLNGGTTYYVRAYAKNNNGTGYGNELTFTTLCSTPLSTTDAATNIGTTTVTLNGTVNANNFSATVTFEYGTTTAYGTSIAAIPNIVNGNSNITVSTGLTGLTPNTVYHYRVISSNCGGTVNGNDQTFTTICTAPTANSLDATNIESTSATLNGIVNGNNFSTIVTFEYGTSLSYDNSIPASQSPVVGNSNTNVNAIITGLFLNTVYHYRPKAVNCGGTIYGSNIDFTTLAAVSTTEISNVTTTTATSGGYIEPGGGAPILARGVCWSTIQNPIVGSNKTVDGSGYGIFVSNITGLQANTEYYIRAYSTSNTGTTSYGNQRSFTTDPLTITDIDGNIYNVIRIGTQLWMKENLKTTKYTDGTNIPTGYGGPAWSNLETPAFCLYNGDIQNKNIYGALYNWYAADTTILCPTGWHVPSDDEWTILIDYLGGESIAGGKLKEVGTVHWAVPNYGATNESGFTGLPGGWRPQSFYNIYYDGYWWSSSKHHNSIFGFDYGYYHYLDYNSKVITTGSGNSEGLSVRCVKN
jgi:uncharacterized protein (TIGR02145 family)